MVVLTFTGCVKEMLLSSLRNQVMVV